MNTTNLFVELIVIGIGAAIWVFCLVASVFGEGWVIHDAFEKPLGIGLVVGIVYVLGILTDRMADALFEASVSKRIKRSVFCGEENRFYKYRRVVALHSNACFNLLEYNRSRARICRGWALNSFLSMFAVNIFLWRTNCLREYTGCLSSAFLLMGIGSFFAWYQLKTTECVQIKETAEFYRDRETLGASDVGASG